MSKEMSVMLDEMVAKKMDEFRSHGGSTERFVRLLISEAYLDGYKAGLDKGAEIHGNVYGIGKTVQA
jgi:hypothetical protein